MDVWDRLCTSLHVRYSHPLILHYAFYRLTKTLCFGCREVTVTDTSRKKSVDFRLLHSVAHGGPWFARWGYVLRLGSFGVTKEVYARAVDELASLPLDTLVAEANKAEGNGSYDLGRIIAGYRRLRWSDPWESFTRLANVRDLLSYLLCLKHRPNTLQSTTPASRSRQQKKRVSSFVEKRKRCRDFDIVAEELGSRWPARRLRTAAQVIVDALLEKGGMTRQEVRDVARLTIGDTGLLDFVLKWLGNCVVGRHVVRRTSNPITRVLEFSLEEVGAGEAGSTEALEMVEVESTQTELDVRMICDAIVAARPDAARAVLDCKHWVKTFGLVDDKDDRLRFFCVWAPSEEEKKELTRPMGPPEVLVVEALASVGDLRKEAERAMRETYCMMESFKVKRMEGVEGEEWDPVMLGGAESGSVVVVSGESADLDCDLRYEGGMDTWAVGCACGAQDDDGERMVECDGCEVWHHTRCIGISDGLPVPPLFLCSRCSSSILGAAASVETGRDLAW
ncbi:hypothetical protein HPP92_002033 [Vanilla planifolia]|uniref:PHD-type domain-containing protein n=1 Tax=Vanilla planifolia TaxID=51239 RepID=A0A835S8X7_VANPL|nr:hypothetical protein HPP92_002033 [Vanilla planifolia]